MPTLLTLPPELRQEIYSYLLLVHNVIPETVAWRPGLRYVEGWNTSRFPTMCPPEIATALFRVNREISAEALSYFYSRNGFIGITVGRRSKELLDWSLIIPHCPKAGLICKRPDTVQHFLMTLHIDFFGEQGESRSLRESDKLVTVLSAFYLHRFMRFVNRAVIQKTRDRRERVQVTVHFQPESIYCRHLKRQIKQSIDGLHALRTLRIQSRTDVNPIEHYGDLTKVDSSLLCPSLPPGDTASGSLNDAPDECLTAYDLNHYGYLNEAYICFVMATKYAKAGTLGAHNYGMRARARFKIVYIHSLCGISSFWGVKKQYKDAIKAACMALKTAVTDLNEMPVGRTSQLWVRVVLANQKAVLQVQDTLTCFWTREHGNVPDELRLYFVYMLRILIGLEVHPTLLSPKVRECMQSLLPVAGVKDAQDVEESWPVLKEWTLLDLYNEMKPRWF